MLHSPPVLVFVVVLAIRLSKTQLLLLMAKKIILVLKGYFLTELQLLYNLKLIYLIKTYQLFKQLNKKNTFGFERLFLINFSYYTT